jgi:flagellar protein FliS
MTASLARATAAYQEVNVAARSPLELVVLLYDGALSAIAQAQEAIDAKDMVAKRKAMSKGLAIIGHLQSTLNMDEGKEVAEQLDRLYVYVTDKLIEFNVQGRGEALREAHSVLTTLREAWSAIAQSGGGTAR